MIKSLKRCNKTVSRKDAWTLTMTVTRFKVIDLFIFKMVFKCIYWVMTLFGLIFIAILSQLLFFSLLQDLRSKTNPIYWKHKDYVS